MQLPSSVFSILPFTFLAASMSVASSNGAVMIGVLGRGLFRAGICPNSDLAGPTKSHEKLGNRIWLELTPDGCSVVDDLLYPRHTECNVHCGYSSKVKGLKCHLCAWLSNRLSPCSPYSRT